MRAPARADIYGIARVVHARQPTMTGTYRMRRSISLLLSMALIFSMTPTTGFAAQFATPAATAAPAPRFAAVSTEPTAAFVPDSVIVKFKDPITTAGVNKFAGAHDLATSDVSRGADKRQMSVNVPDGSTLSGFIDQLNADPTVEFADRNYIRHVTIAANPNDPDYTNAQTLVSSGVNYANARSWWLRNSGASAFWNNYNNIATAFPARADASAIKVAVIDTGFYMNHPDKGVNIVAGKDEMQTYSHGVATKDSDVTPVSDTAPGTDRQTSAHGTCVAGEIAAASNNGIGSASVGLDLDVVMYKVMGIWTEGDPANGYPAGSAVILDSAIEDAIYDATNDGAKVITMSLGGAGNSTAMQTAVNYAYNHGVVVCAATGNNGVSTNFYPAACANVIGVGSYSLNSSGNRARSSFTNYGTQLDVLAPGVMIYGLTNPTYDLDNSSTNYKPGYEWWQGTSMASPAFAGMLAMVWRFAPTLTNAEITNVVLTSATASGTQPNTNYGYGYVDVNGALAALESAYPYLAKPAVTTTKTAYGAEGVNVAWNAVTGRSVQYQVARDGQTPATTASTAMSFTGLSEGTHTVSVTPVSSYNWYDASNRATYTFSVDKTAPVVSSIAFASDQITWSDTEGAAAHTTRVRIDSNATQTVTGNAFAVPAGTLAEGGHTFYIAETDSVGNTGQTYAYPFTYVNPAVAPPIDPEYTSYSSTVTVIWLADPAVTYQYTLNGGATVSVPSGSATLTLHEGANALRVRTVKGPALSSWADSVVTYHPPVPASPQVSAIPDTSQPSVAVSWSAAAFATSYEYRLNGAAWVTTTSSGASLAGLVKGVNTVGVRARDFSGPSGETTRSFRFTPPVPATPAPHAAAPSVVAPTVGLSWDAIAGAASYEVELNGSSVQPADGTSLAVTGLAAGDNTLRVRALNGYGDASAWSAPIGVVRLVSYNVSSLGPVATVAHAGSTAVVSVSVRDPAGAGLPGIQVRYEYSYDNKNWSYLAVQTTDASGTASYTVAPTKNMWVRPFVSAGTYYLDTTGAAVKISVAADVRAPVKPSGVIHHRTFTIHGYLKPKHTSGAHNVKIKLYRYRSGHYTYYKTVTATNHNYKSYTKYSVSTSVPSSGSWRAYAYYAETTSYAVTTSTYTKFTVK